MKDPRTLSTVPITEAFTLMREALVKKEKKLQKKLGKVEPIPCPQCDKDFIPTRDWQRFCSSLCRTEWHKAALERELKELKDENEELKRQIKELKK